MQQELGSKLLNQYVLTKLLGSGSCGTVYKAVDKNTLESVSIKYVISLIMIKL